MGKGKTEDVMDLFWGICVCVWIYFQFEIGSQIISQAALELSSAGQPQVHGKCLPQPRECENYRWEVLQLAAGAGDSVTVFTEKMPGVELMSPRKALGTESHNSGEEIEIT